MKRVLLLSFALGLFVSISAFVVYFFWKDSRSVLSNLSDLNLPSGLIKKDLAIEQNDLIAEKTSEILQFDDYLLKEFRFGENENAMVLFIAYWQPGNGTQRLAAQHNPDICWVKSGGWSEHRRCEQASLELEARSNKSDSSNSEFDIAGTSELSDPRSIFPIEYRYLKIPDGLEKYHTYFWQVLEGEVRALEEVGPGSYWDYLKSIPERIRAKQHPMWFVRIHSKTPLAPISQGETGSTKLGAKRLELGVGSAERGAESEELEKERSEIAQGLGLKANSSQENEQIRYLVHYPEVRELLRSIRKLTTGEELGADG